MTIWQDLVHAVKQTEIEYPKLKVAMLAQAILESGRGETKLAQSCLNFWGLKFRPEMKDIALPFYIETDSEPSGGAEFCKFSSVRDAVKGYWQFMKRSPYKGVEKHIESGADYLQFIGPIFCPPGYTESWKKAHGMNYDQYIIVKLFPEAQVLLGESSNKDEEMTAELYLNGDLLVMQGGRQIFKYKSERYVLSLVDGLKLVEKYGPKKFTIINKEKPIIFEPVKPPDTQPMDRTYKGILKLGSQGEPVIVLQTRLKELHYEITCNGQYDEATKAAVMAFQHDKRLQEDGVAGPATWAALWGSEEPSRPDANQGGSKQLWIPFAKQVKAISTSWEYPEGYPRGAIVHFTAGSTMESSLDYLRKMGFPCLGIDRDGTIFQPFPLNRGGAHCGTSHHKTHLGIEIAASGTCKDIGDGKYKTWYGAILSQDKIRCSSKRKDNARAGCYEKYTEEQEASLLRLLLWLKSNCPEVFKIENVLGHDEACDLSNQAGRKNDPGFALSMTMPEYRELLKAEYIKHNGV